MLKQKAKLIQDFEFTNKVVLLRADLNVPVVNGVIADETRILRIIPTINYLLNYNAKVVIISHFGQPKAFDENFSLRIVADVLAKILQKKIYFVGDYIGDQVKKTINSALDKSIILLENLRFYPGEKNNDHQFASSLASVADVYVSDAFSCLHRSHASIVKIANFLPTFLGLNLQNELKFLSSILYTGKKPIAAIIGGSKISTKIGVLRNLSQKIDFLILGGAIANNFLIYQGMNVGQSLFENSCKNMVKEVIDFAKNYNCQIVTPIDFVTAKNINDMSGILKNCNNMENDDIILDIGLKTIEEIKNILSVCRTVLWNGPLGAFEYKPFSQGTFSVAKIIADLTKKGLLSSIIGGGDSISAISSSGLSNDDFTYVSTGGGALLQFLSGDELSGLKALGWSDKQ